MFKIVTRRTLPETFDIDSEFYKASHATELRRLAAAPPIVTADRVLVAAQRNQRHLPGRDQFLVDKKADRVAAEQIATSCPPRSGISDRAGIRSVAARNRTICRVNGKTSITTLMTCAPFSRLGLGWWGEGSRFGVSCERTSESACSTPSPLSRILFSEQDFCLS